MDPHDLATALATYGPYPADHPPTLRELLAADPDTISHPLAWFLRSQALEVSRAADQHFVTGPAECFRLLRNGYALHPWTDKWVSYGLTGRRQLIQLAHERGGTRPMRVATALLPKKDDLPRLPHTSHGRQPAWLVIYGGDPQVLSKKGVAQGLATLQRRAPVSDVVFYQAGSEQQAPTMWSLRAGVGWSYTGTPAGQTVPFPDELALTRARGEEKHDDPA